MSATDWSELNGYDALVAELRATPPVAPERLRQRVLALEPGPRHRMSGRRRLALVVVPVAVVLAVGAALVHGFVDSGSNDRSRAEVLGLAAGQAATPDVAGKIAHRALRPATTVASGALAQKSYAPAHFNALQIPKNRLVHASASLEVRVPSRSALSKATNRATQIVASLGGYAQSVRYQSFRRGGGGAVLALRVPVQKAEKAIGRLGNLGTLLSQQVSTKDLQQQLTQETNQIGSLRRAIAVYLHALQSGSLSASERVQIQIRLANARHAITEQRKARTGTLASGATSDISLTLTTNKNAGVFGAHHHKDGRFDRLLGSAASFLALEGIIVLYALIVVGPLLLLGGLAWWLVRERRRREDSRLLASA